MNPHSDEPERRLIRDAMARLLDGDPIRSDGKLTVKSLAAEAGLKRWYLTHKHTDLRDEFYDRVRAQGTTPAAMTTPPRRDRRPQRGPQAGPGRAARRHRTKGDPRPRDTGTRTRERSTQSTGERTRAGAAQPTRARPAERTRAGAADLG